MRLLGLMVLAITVPAVSALTLLDYTDVSYDTTGWTSFSKSYYFYNMNTWVDITNTVTNETDTVVPPGYNLGGVITVAESIYWTDEYGNPLIYWDYDGVDTWSSTVGDMTFTARAVNYDGRIDDGYGTFLPYWNVGDGTLDIVPYDPSETYVLTWQFNFDPTIGPAFNIHAPEYALEVEPVAEPVTAGLLGLGLLALARRKER